jgi:hypothetical protein
MSHDDLDLDALADSLDAVDRMVGERLSPGELDRRRLAIIERSRRPATPARPRRRLYSLAAAVVAVLVLSVAALFIGGGSRPVTGDAMPGVSHLDPLNQQGGLGGPELTGEKYSATDPRTGVHLDVALESKPSGTHLDFAVANLAGPGACRLVAVHTDGTTETLTTWAVGEEGWGTAANPEPLMLEALTLTPRQDIAYLQVQKVTPAGPGGTLVRVP